MKKLLSILLSLLILISAVPFLSLTATAVKYGSTPDGLYYKCSDDNTIAITNYLGKATDVVIPETINGAIVVAIEKKAFNSAEHITSISIPKTVTTIGMDAFLSCTSLKAVYIESAECWRNTQFKNKYSDPSIHGATVYINGEKYNGYFFSGGSGTEDDPYLISNTDDVKELFYNIELKPSLYSTKLYYKLTGDLTVYQSLSPLYIDDYIGPNCFIETQHSLTGFGPKSEATISEITHIINEIGPLQSMYESYIYPHRGMPDIGSIKRTVVSYRFASSDEYFSKYSTGAFDDSGSYYERYRIEYHTKLYRSAAFTGVLDGDGHTLTIASGQYLFGFLENGAEIKNLNIKSSSGSLAYKIDETCTISNCSFNINKPSELSYLENSYFSLEESDYGYENWVIKRSHKTVSDFVSINQGRYVDCINISPVYSPVSAQAQVFRYVNLCAASPETDSSEFYSLEKCTAAKGDPAAYSGFDFENTWVMIQDIPHLRIACKANSGDLNVDGTVNCMDSNLMKRHLTGTGVSEAFIFLGGADINLDGDIDAMDSARIRRAIYR